MTVNIGVKDRAWIVWRWMRKKRERMRWETLPFALILKLTLSITSTNASFFLYFTSARLQLVTPVAWLVILDDSSYLDECDEGLHCDREGKGRRTTAMFVETMLSVVMYVFNVSISLFWGYPKSFISMACQRLSISMTLWRSFTGTDHRWAHI